MNLVTGVERFEVITLPLQEVRENCTEVFGEVCTETKTMVTLFNVQEKTKNEF